MTDQPARLEVTPGMHERAIAFLDRVKEEDWSLDWLIANAMEEAHRLAHTVPGDVGLREENERLSKAVIGGVLGELCNDEEKDALVDFIRQLRAGSTSPVIDTNEGLAERVREVDDAMVERALQAANIVPNVGWSDGLTEGVARIEWLRMERALRAALDQG